MVKPTILLLLMLLVSSCQKKKSIEPNVQRMDNYVPPASEAEIDTTQSYISPSDAFSDRSIFSKTNFAVSQVKYRGTRSIYYHISQPAGNAVAVVVEYLSGARKNGDTVSTATRILMYSDDLLMYRKAFTIEFSDAINFSTVRKFDHTVLKVSPTKSIVYYWFNEVYSDGSIKKEYHAVCVDKEGITNDLSGDFIRIGSSYGTIRFLNESRLKAKVPPNTRYPYMAIDLIFSIDWKTCTAAMDVPVDTIFTVSDQPSRYFNSKIKLQSSPEQSSPVRETNFRRLTQAQMQRVFVPSLFDVTNIERDKLFIEFNRTVKGWIDYKTMTFEEIILEN